MIVLECFGGTTICGNTHITWNVSASMNQCTGEMVVPYSSSQQEYFTLGDETDYTHAQTNKNLCKHKISNNFYSNYQKTSIIFCPSTWQLLKIIAVLIPSMSFPHPSIPGLRVVPAMVGHLWDGGTHLKGSSISALGHVTVWTPLNNHSKKIRTYFFLQYHDISNV